MNRYVLDLKEVDKTSVSQVGGKGANLGELTTIDGIRVPAGFCVNTEAYKEIITNNAGLNALLDQLSGLQSNDRNKISPLASKIRKVIEATPVARHIHDQVARYLEIHGHGHAYAVRSSATAEDLPTASFAGQQDTYMNIVGSDEIIGHIRKCWASLFTDRAVTYRIQNNFDHRKVYLSVVVQKMIFPQASGIMFTADPISNNRKVVSIDASFGLGEALVSGVVNADNYKVRDGAIITKTISTKKIAIHSSKDGGTEQREIGVGDQDLPSLEDEQILQLECIGRRIEKHFGAPQDIEWCIANGAIYIVQSRPITTLFPVPEANDDLNHVYVSVGHQQMMTDPMKPLGLSFFLMTTPALMRTAGGRLFVDITAGLSSPSGRENLLNVLGQSDPLIKDALLTVLGREGFIKEHGIPDTRPAISAASVDAKIDIDPTIITGLIANSRASIQDLVRNIQSRSGVELLDFIDNHIKQVKASSDPRSLAVIMTAFNATLWINEKMKEWLGEKNVADTVTQSAPNNVTSEMGLELMDVADVIRKHPAVINYLQQPNSNDFLDELEKLDGGKESRNAIVRFLDKYGMRGVGEIDITRDRWSEKPILLVPMILGNIKNLEAGASTRKFEEGRQKALRKEEELLNRLRSTDDGDRKAAETKRVIGLLRSLIGYREYPKYFIVNRYFIYRTALLKEAEKLVGANVIPEKEDIYYLTFEELRDVIRTNTVDYRIITKRKEDYKLYEKLTPPRVITSEGEFVTGKYKREGLPAGAIAGLAVSSGIVEGRARVILSTDDADLEDGDILVTSFTDPSWTPLFVSIKGLITEVGGLMTHGAVIAREYGLPAVVGVENATKLIKDGQRIRVNGTEGWVEVL